MLTDTRPAQTKTDSTSPNIWQGSHNNASFVNHWYYSARVQTRIPDLPHLRQTLSIRPLTLSQHVGAGPNIPSKHTGADNTLPRDSLRLSIFEFYTPALNSMDKTWEGTFTQFDFTSWNVRKRWYLLISDGVRPNKITITILPIVCS